MNNPAAAITRAAGQISGAIDRLGRAMGAAQAAGIGDRVDTLLDASRGVPEPLSSVARSDREAEVEDLLDDLEVADGWRLAPDLVAAGLDAVQLRPLLADVDATAVTELISAAADAAALTREVEEGSTRLSAIVGALKSYSHLDRAEVQEVEVRQGVEDTLLILKRKLDGIEVVRQYPEEPVLAEVYASELNQVWTNLIDNAADALAGVSSPRITIRVLPGDESFVVEVEDNGSGIPEDIAGRVFDAFFTTKPPGAGTGLGLDISYGIVTDRHGGELTVESEPGRTVFRAALPIRQGD